MLSHGQPLGRNQPSFDGASVLEIFAENHESLRWWLRRRTRAEEPTTDSRQDARPFEEIRPENHELATLVEVARDLSSTLDLHEVLRRVVRHARRLLGGRVATLLLTRGDHFETVSTDGAGPAYLARSEPLLRDSIAGHVVRTGLPIVVHDVREDERYHLNEVAQAEGLAGLLSVPLRTKDRILGALHIYGAEPGRFGPQDVALATLLAQQSAIAIENADLFREARAAGEHLRESEKLAALGRLSAGLAHELRNPLNTLAILAYAMGENAAADAGLRADVAVMRSEIRRMTLLLEQFLDFARPSEPRFARQRAEEILEETLILITPEAAKRKIAIQRGSKVPLPAVWADGNRLKQVFLNLALNALQAMPDGGTLRTGARRAQGGVVIEMIDTGTGIPEAIRDRLFEPFFTTRHGGTGLGLSIAQRIVEAHSGRITLDSAAGEGTTAQVWIPL